MTELLDEAKPDVVHITTPPQGHFDLAKTCLDRGCHIYIEKPFTVWADEAHKLIAIANEKQLKVTAGHDDQFSHVSRRMRSLVHSGYLGGGHPIHMESYYCYEIGKTGYAGALLGDKQHWVRRLPGKLLQNIISHGIARIAEFLVSDSPEVLAYGFTSPLLRGLGETEIIDELRVIIRDADDSHRVLHVFFSDASGAPWLSDIRPEERSHPRSGSRDTDQTAGHTLQELRGKVVPPITLAGQYLQNVATNFKAFSVTTST